MASGSDNAPSLNRLPAARPRGPSPTLEAMPWGETGVPPARPSAFAAISPAASSRAGPRGQATGNRLRRPLLDWLVGATAKDEAHPSTPASPAKAGVQGPASHPPLQAATTAHGCPPARGCAAPEGQSLHTPHGSSPPEIDPADRFLARYALNRLRMVGGNGFEPLTLSVQNNWASQPLECPLPEITMLQKTGQYEGSPAGQAAPHSSGVSRRSSVSPPQTTIS